MEAEKLRSLIIPYRGGMTVLPNSMVVEVLPYAPPLGLENAPPWVLGSMLWKAQPLVLVSLEYLSRQKAGGGMHNRIIVVQAITGQPKLGYLGFVGSEAPRILDLMREEISKEIFLENSAPGVAEQVLIQGERAIIPNFDLIEKTISELLNHDR